MKPLLFTSMLCLGATALLAQGPRRVDSVDPFIGTQGMGHAYPGATVPFGFVQLSPDTDTATYSLDGKTYNKDVYRYCAGYQFGDPTIVGFSHTHLHGTGHSDLGDLLVMPTVGALKLDPGTVEQPGSGYRSRYRGEVAKPGYYGVELTDPGVKAELTATSRVGFHRYTFPKSADSRIVLDLVHAIYNYEGKVLWSRVQVQGPDLVTGYRHVRGWARDRHLYFAMAFSKPFKAYGQQNQEPRSVYQGFWRKWDQTSNFPEMAGKALKLHFDFDTEAGEAIQVKVALSAVSEAGALANLRAETPHWDFDRVRHEAADAWERELARIDFAGTESQRRSFYTAFYHSLLGPVEFQDVDGHYRGVDGLIDEAKGFTNHTVFSLWDTHRALHPLYTLIEPKRAGDMVQSMLAHYDQSPWKMLPIWSHHGQENWCMIGYHAVSVIADAWLKGIRGFDGNRAFEAMKATATALGYDGLGDYMKLGWVPDDGHSSSASKTLEYAYDDWAIAQMARDLGRKEDEAAFTKRAFSSRNLWDPKTGFMRARRRDGQWREPFDPMQTHDQGYIEGNAWNYSLYMPHDAAWLVAQSGGGEAFAKHLDELFTMHLDDKFFAETEDLGRESMMGNYAHGNEPSHHVPYLYVWAGQPWKTQEKVRAILEQMYQNRPDGLCGNDDVGQMSAWYLFGALGFYPVAPGSNEYVIGAPASREMAIAFEDGRRLVLRAPKLDAKNTYVQGITLNGRPWDKAYFRHEDLVKGGEIVYHMGPKPNKAWGTAPAARPYALPMAQRP
ncbi:GH92 family glycosyl hydrolase [Geothrix sp. PMB-07]|uniref:GH92 family glycosyl hydrolase n=1 Tax=Geothrix sp. PMB-07 TaxID=3068640 RepID=UPI0027416D4D|nr:GH92 family glycosyl hydrolase [Geothrix sp. PMB-07]WLT31078.1 GH92 family glycosyl hydrolase [Geothrix sp. PMB-07]